jgi:hypothetical protein
MPPRSELPPGIRLRSRRCTGRAGRPLAIGPLLAEPPRP